MFVDDEVINTLPGYLLYTEKREPWTMDWALPPKNLQLVKLNERSRPDIDIRAAEGIIGFDPGNLDDLFMELDDAHMEKAESAETSDFQDHIRQTRTRNPENLAAGARDRHRETKPSFMTLTELRQKIAGELDPALKSSTSRR